MVQEERVYRLKTRDKELVALVPSPSPAYAQGQFPLYVRWQGRVFTLEFLCTDDLKILPDYVETDTKETEIMRTCRIFDLSPPERTHGIRTP